MPATPSADRFLPTGTVTFLFTDIEGSTRLIINLKAAKALGLTIPQSLLLRANEVIQ